MPYPVECRQISAIGEDKGQASKLNYRGPYVTILLQTVSGGKHLLLLCGDRLIVLS